jgi:hypothetical protein
MNIEIFAQPVKNGSQAANQRFFDFPEIRMIYGFHTHLSLIIFLAKKILSRGEAIFQRSHIINLEN